MIAIAVVGPTASGKSSIAMRIAEVGRGEIVSVDSMQVYRGMDIGTAKATHAMRERVPHHLIDIVEPEIDLAVAEFQHAGAETLNTLEARGVAPVICGGSGLHFRALVDPLDFPPHDDELRDGIDSLAPEEAREQLMALDPDVAEHVDLANPRRVTRALEIAQLTGLTPSQRAASPEAQAVRSYTPSRDFVAVGLDPGDGLLQRVEERFDGMLRAGLLDEVARVGPRMGRLAAQAVGYKELRPVVDDKADLATGRDAAIRATMALAKRQRTFFRRDPRIAWIPWDHDPAVRWDRVAAHLDKVVAWNS